MTNDSTEQMRKAFEKWYNSRHRYHKSKFTRTVLGDYVNTNVYVAWASYQAAIASLVPVLEEAREALEWCGSGDKAEQALTSINRVLGDGK